MRQWSIRLALVILSSCSVVEDNKQLMNELEQSKMQSQEEWFDFQANDTIDFVYDQDFRIQRIFESKEFKVNQKTSQMEITDLHIFLPDYSKIKKPVLLQKTKSQSRDEIENTKNQLMKNVLGIHVFSSFARTNLKTGIWYLLGNVRVGIYDTHLLEGSGLIWNSQDEKMSSQDPQSIVTIYDIKNFFLTGNHFQWDKQSSTFELENFTMKGVQY